MEMTPIEKVSPSVFSYTDYRKYLQDAYQFLKMKNPQFSESAFVQRAGLKSSSRGYLGLIIRNKRNISSKTIAGFIQALKLSDKEAMYFENLVYFNQADSSKDKLFYLGRLKNFASGSGQKYFQLLSSQYRYYSHWYYVVIRELVALDHFREDLDWIYLQLERRVGKKEIAEVIADLLHLQLLARDAGGKLIQNETLLNFIDNEINFNEVVQVHREFFELGIEKLQHAPYSQRSATNTCIACCSKDFSLIREEINRFRTYILEKFGQRQKHIDCVLNLGTQLYFTTPTQPEVK